MTGCNSRLLPLVLFAAVVLPCLAHAAALQAELDKAMADQKARDQRLGR